MSAVQLRKTWADVDESASVWTDGTFIVGDPEHFGYTGDGTTPEGSRPRQMVSFLSPSQIKAFQLPPGHCLIGDNHIQLGAPFVIGGAPGVGKSRALTRLAIC